MSSQHSFPSDSRLALRFIRSRMRKDWVWWSRIYSSHWDKNASLHFRKSWKVNKTVTAKANKCSYLLCVWVCISIAFVDYIFRWFHHETIISSTKRIEIVNYLIYWKSSKAKEREKWEKAGFSKLQKWNYYFFPFNFCSFVGCKFCQAAWPRHNSDATNAVVVIVAI